MNENHTHSSTSSVLRALLEGTELPEEKEMIPEEQLIDAGYYDLKEDELIDLLTLVRNSTEPTKYRHLLQYKLTILLYRKYIE